MSVPACPICRKPSVPDFAPFCSSRHRDRDLLQWLGEGYRIPGRPVDPSQVDLGHIDGDGLDRTRDAD